jgi:hypothetical protein
VTGGPEVPAGTAAYSIDELRALARLAGVPLPPLLLDGWHPDDADVADTVAVRSLLARGALRLVDVDGEPSLGLTAATRAALGPLLAPKAYGEVTHLPAGGAERRQVVVRGDGGTLRLAEREPDVWTLEWPDGTVEQVIGRLAADVLDGGARPAALGGRVTVQAAVLREADRLAAAGRPGAAVPLLVEAGVARDDALSWAAVLRHRVATGAVRLARQVAPDVYVGGDVCWVDGGVAGVWRVEDAQPADPADPADAGAPVGAEPEDRRVLTDVGVAGVQAAVAALLGPEGLDEPAVTR